MPVLLVTNPDGARRTVEWVDGSVGIGRDLSNHLVIEDPKVGRWHAAIFEEAGPSYRLRDLGSRKGTLVAGKRIRSHSLREGDEFQVGSYTISFASGTHRGRRPSAGHELHIRFAADEQDPIGRGSKTTPLSGRIEWESPPEPAVGTARPSPRQRCESVQAVAARLDLDELLECLLEQIERLAAPSVMFAALVRDDRSLDIRQRRSRLRSDPGPHGIEVSQSVVDRTMESQQPILVSRADATLSMHRLGIAWAIGLPLVAQGRARAIVYADWRQWGKRTLDQERELLEWVAALALHAGAALGNALHYGRLQARTERLETSQRSQTQIVGMSPDTRDLLDTVDLCAARDFDVLIQGPTGTGKELVARRIHERSARRDGPFVVVNCASIPRELFESEMFGHRKGSFSGATTDRQGRFQEANCGTLFLDELGELAMDHQARLLRAIEDHQVTPIGGQPVAVDLRIVAATNRDLEKATDQGTFRIDLINRLGIPIKPTPLKDRPQDIPILAYYLLDRLTQAEGEDYRDIAPEVIEHLLQHPLPGNVRELRRFLRDALVHAGPRIELRDLTRGATPSHGEKSLPSLAKVEADHIRRVLEATAGHQGRAAKILGISPNTLKAKMDLYRIRRDDFRG